MEDRPNPHPDDCSGPLHPMAVEGLRLFNRGEYWKAHEALEDAWRAETGEIRHLYRGILQVGVAYFHVKNRNYTGAIKLQLRSRKWLTPFSGVCRGIDVDRLKLDFEQAMAEVRRLGPDRLGDFDQALLKPVAWETEHGHTV